MELLELSYFLVGFSALAFAGVWDWRRGGKSLLRWPLKWGREFIDFLYGAL